MKRSKVSKAPSAMTSSFGSAADTSFDFARGVDRIGLSAIDA